jgi:2-iminoacetate synthase
MYDPDSSCADDFISANEVIESLQAAETLKNDRYFIKELLDKAKNLCGLSHRDAIVLLECADEFNQEIFNIAADIKKKLYGDRIVLFAPLYISNYCINGCLYCPYHAKSKDIIRKKLSQDEIRNEVMILQGMGHKRLALEAGEDPINAPIDYILESIDTIYSCRRGNDAIKRVNVNIAATTCENYEKLHNAQIGTYILFQETYHKKSYEHLHPTGPKSDYNYHTEAMDRAMIAGIDDVGIGVLFGLDSYKYNFVSLIMHAEHLEKKFGIGPHTISLPRVRDASGVNAKNFNSISDDTFKKIIAVLRIAIPYAGLIISTRESKYIREQVLSLGVSQISAASSTSVGGYAIKQNNTAQFDINDTRTLDEIICWLLELGYIPSFCTACYEQKRTGHIFMNALKSGSVNCLPNALLTLNAYIKNYASDKTKEIARNIILNQIKNIPSNQLQCVLQKLNF